MSLQWQKISPLAESVLRIFKPPSGLTPLPPLIVVQVGKQHVLLHGFGQSSHALVVFWDDLEREKKAA